LLNSSIIISAKKFPKISVTNGDGEQRKSKKADKAVLGMSFPRTVCASFVDERAYAVAVMALDHISGDV